MDFNLFKCEECHKVLFGADLSGHIQETHHQRFIVAGLDNAETNTMEANTIRVERALILSALEVFGNGTKEALYFYLVQRGIDFGKRDISLRELEAAFTDLLGKQGASILISMIHNKLNEKSLVL